MERIESGEAGRALAAQRRKEERECRVCGRRFATSGRGAYCGHACKKRAYRARKLEESVLGTDRDPLLMALAALRAEFGLDRPTTFDSAEAIRQAREERDEDIWRAVTS